jgi:transposase
MIDKFFPSTQLCPQCGALNKLKVSDRIYKCECGFVEDRDIKSAQCIETEGLKKIPTDHREFKLEENSSSTFLNLLTSINGIKVSKKSSLSQEAAGLVLP